MDTKINLIDTPGYLDYFGEVVTGLHAADAAVVVVSGTAGSRWGPKRSGKSAISCTCPASCSSP